jgi:hypothetical protein
LHKQHGKRSSKAIIVFLWGLFERFCGIIASDIQKTEKTAKLFTLRLSRDKWVEYVEKEKLAYFGQDDI